MNQFKEFLNQPLILTLGWTLVHFLWQGIAIAGLLFLAQAFLRKRSANSRYVAACLALLVMVIAPLTTFVNLAKPLEPQPVFNSVTSSFHETVFTGSANMGLLPARVTQVPPQPQPQNFRSLLEAALPWLAGGWLAIVSVLSMRLFIGCLRVRQLKRSAREAMGEAWDEKLARLAELLKVSRPVRLCKSVLVEVPTVIGWLRPVILFPAGTLANLSPAQLEAILVHELSHIRRHDYAVNLLQNVVETLLFYHPAVWWVSQHISQERENCCDDITVKVCGDRIAYARALATLEELRSAPVELSLAADGGSLLRRIRRLLGLPPGSDRSGVWVAGTLAILTVAVLVLANRSSLWAADSQNRPAGLEIVESVRPLLQIRLVAQVGDASPVDELPGPSANPQRLRVLKTIHLDETDFEAQSARLQESPVDQRPEISLTLTEAGAEKFTRLTEQNVGRKLVVIFDGTVLNAPIINEKIPGKQLILGYNLTKAEVESIASKLNLIFGAKIEKKAGESTPSDSAAKNQDTQQDKISELRNQRIAPAVLVQDARLLIEMGNLDDAEAKLRQALKENSEHQGAFYYLNYIQETRHAHEAKQREITAREKMLQVEQSWNAPLRRERLPVANLFIRTNLINTSPQRQRIYEKLNQIVLEEVLYDGIALSEVVRNLNEETRKRDPDKRGINFIIISQFNPPASPPSNPLDPNTARPLPRLASREPVDLNKVVIRLTPTLRNIRLADVVDAVTKVAEVPIKFSVEDYAIVFTQKFADESPQLFTRTFNVNPVIFLEALQKTSGGSVQGAGGGFPSPRVDLNGGAGLGLGGGGLGSGLGGGGLGSGLGGGSGGVGSGGITFQEQKVNYSAMVREFFSTLGLSFPTNAPGGGGLAGGSGYLGSAAASSGASQRNSMFFNERTGVLFVRASLEELDIIEKAVQTLNITPPQVRLEVKIAEITQADSKALGFDWFLGNTLMNGGASPTPPADSPAARSPASGTNSQQQIDATKTNQSAALINGILTEPQFRMVLRALEQRSGVDILSTPTVSTLSGRPARISVTEPKTVVESQRGASNTLALSTNVVEVGPSVQMTPSVAADGYSIQLAIDAKFVEFLGYDDPGAVVFKTAEGLPLRSIHPLPKFRIRQVVSNVDVWDGQTVVVGGLVAENVVKYKDKVPVLGDIPLLGRFFRSESKGTSKKNLLIFITPTIIDPAGNRVHAVSDPSLNRTNAPASLAK